jgi:hypothetical protein
VTYIQQPGSPQGQPWGYQPQQPPPSNGLATAGFVVALIGAVLSLIPIIGTVSWLISPVGLVLSLVGLVFSGQRRTGKGLAIAGTVLGALGIMMCILYTAAFASAFNDAPRYSAGSGVTVPRYPTSSTAPTANPAAGTYPAGTYQVGVEMAPGTYATTGSSHCYWARLRGNSGEFGDIIANDNVQGQGSFSVRSTDGYVELSGTCTWQRR